MRRYRESMKFFCALFLATGSGSAFLSSASADTLYLKNGRSVEGFITSQEQETVQLDVGYGTIKFKQNEIGRIEKSDRAEADALRQKWQKARMRAQEIRTQKEREPKPVAVQKVQQGHIVVDAVLNKAVRASLLLDTGASLIVLSKSAGRKLGFSADRKKSTIQLQMADGRKVDAQFVVLQSVSVQGIEVRNVDAAVMSEDAGGADCGDGLLGMSFLKKFNFKIDQRNQKLVLEKLE